MLALVVATLLNGGTAISAADVGAARLPELFVSACLNGEARLAPGEATASSFEALPRGIQQSLGTPASAQVWRLTAGGDAYLYTLNYAPGSGLGTSPRICGLASDEMSLGAAADAVEMRVTGTVHPRTTRTIEWTDPQGGYTAFATTSGKYKVVQVNWLSEEQRAAVIDAYNRATH